MVDDKPDNNMLLDSKLAAKFEKCLHVKHFDLKVGKAGCNPVWCWKLVFRTDKQLY